MKWEQYRSVMERYAIKTDDMASEDAYFMATHMPFSSLEIYTGGRVSAPAVLMSEEEVFEKLICNPENEHRMIIVRGDNGTGKSHLIRYFKARFVNSPATVYNPATEQLVFLRRLNNSTYIIGDPAAGKSFATRLFKLLTTPIAAADKIGKEAINAYREQMRTKGANKEKPKKPKVVVRVHPARTSNASINR